MRRWALPCGLIAGLLVLVVVLCALILIAGIVGLGRLAESLPTPPPRPTLIVGETYWIGAVLPPPGLPAGLAMPHANLYNKPGSGISDPSVTIVAVLNDATPVRLTGIRDEWCYVEAPDQFGQHVEGWLHCDRLLDYEPTPFPTPNLTPEKP
jgi:hypothetical protein